MKRLLLGRRKNVACPWILPALSLFAVSVLIFGGFVYLLSNAPATADLTAEFVIGAMMVLMVVLIVAQALRDGGLLIGFGLATVPILGAAMTTELLLAVGAVTFDVPGGERLEIYGLLLVAAYVIGSMAYATGAALAWQIRRAPDNWWVWRAGSRTPASQHDGNRIDTWLGSLGPLGFSIVLVTVVVGVGAGYGMVQTAIGLGDVSLPHLIGHSVVWSLSFLGLFSSSSANDPGVTWFDSGATPNEHDEWP